VAALFPERPPPARARILAQSALVRASNAALGRLVARVGVPALARRCDVRAAAAAAAAIAAGRGLVVATWHAGLVAGIGATLVHLGARPLVLRYHEADDERDDGSVINVVTRGRPAAALHDAIRHARAGGAVVVALDAPAHPRRLDPPFTLLGRALHLPRGAAAIARLGRADLVAGAVVRRGLGLGLVTSARLPVVADDVATMRGVVAWWDAWLRARPADLWPEGAAALARHPRR